MTTAERRLVFVHAKMTDVYNDLSHVLNLLDKNARLINEDPEIRRSIVDAYMAAEKAHYLLDHQAAQHTDYGDDPSKEDK